MRTVTAQDGTSIWYRDWGTGLSPMFLHGRPLETEAWEAQILVLASNDFHLIADNRRGYGRSSQTRDANNMVVICQERDLKEVTRVGYSIVGGEVARYIGHSGTTHVVEALRLPAMSRCNSC